MDQQTPVDQQKRTIEWLNRLIMLAQWHRKLPFHAVRLLSDPIEYQAFLTRVRAATDKAQLADSSTESTPLAVARKKLLEAVVAVPAIQELFGSGQDPFKDATPDVVELLAEVSDVVADSQNTVYSRNGTLSAVIDAMRKSSELDPDPLIVESLKKFFTLIETEPAAENEKSTAELLYDLAVSPHWYIVMASLRADLDYTRDEEPGDATLKATFELWRQKIAKPTVQKLLLKPGHLARAPRKLISLVWEHRDLFVEARAKIPENAREKNPDDERKQVADSAFLLFEEKFKTHLDAIRADLKVLAMVASHFLNVRKFAKFDGFVYMWPQIAQLGRANFAALRYVEELLLNRAPRPDDSDLDARDARELYTLIEKNERLKGFLRLRPYFREINEDELMQYRPLAPIVITAASSARLPEASMLESVDVAPQPQPAPPSPAPSPPTTKTLQVQTLNIKRDETVNPTDKGFTYNVSFAKDMTGQVTFNVQQLLTRILAAMGVSGDSGLQEILKELFSADPKFAEERIRRGSVELVTNTLPLLSKPLSEVLATPHSLRLVVNSHDRDIHYLPWEWWPTSSATLLLSSPDHSVVRGFSWPDLVILPEPIFAPLRLMSIIPNPPQGRRFTSDVTLKALDDLKRATNMQYFPLVGNEVTRESVQRQVEGFKPHVVHFEGYLDAVTYPNRQSVVLAGSLGEVDGWEMKQFGSELREKGVQLLVIGRNSVSRVYENACATAAFELAQQGLTLIAPMRAIDDASATTFTTEFYRAFLQGNKLESALHLARRDLAAKGGDWTVFALFADPSKLDDFQLLRESA